MTTYAPTPPPTSTTATTLPVAAQIRAARWGIVGWFVVAVAVAAAGWVAFQYGYPRTAVAVTALAVGPLWVAWRFARKADNLRPVVAYRDGA